MRRPPALGSGWAQSLPVRLIKRERIRRKIYPVRSAARQDVFEYIELFHNLVRRLGLCSTLVPVRRHRNEPLEKSCRSCAPRLRTERGIACLAGPCEPA